MPLPKPKSALIFNNYLGDNDEDSKMSGLLDSEEVNFIFLLSDFYYDLSSEKRFTKITFPIDYNKEYGKVKLDDVKKVIEKKSTKKSKKFSKDFEVPTPEYLIFEHFPDFVKTAEMKTPYNLYSNDFFTLIKSSQSSVVTIDNISSKVESTINNLKIANPEYNDFVLKKIFDVVKSSNVNGLFVPLKDLFGDQRNINQANNTTNRKEIVFDEKTIAILDYIFTTGDEDFTIPYVSEKIPDKPMANMPPIP